jgi:putative effector of murein hydrolase
MTGVADIWTYLSQGPLLWLTATLAAYALGDALFRAAGRKPFANAVLIAVAILGAVLLATGTPYATYFEGAQFVHFLLGPATVALALPLWEARAHVRRAVLPILAALVVGSTVAIQSTTAPVAIGIAQAVGGSATLTAVLVILTGITGAVVATPLLNLLGMTDWRARGFAVGVAAHGLGTARALQVHPVAGAFAGLGMGLNAVLTAFLAPLLLGLFR